jgi:hypothetical protein
MHRRAIVLQPPTVLRPSFSKNRPPLPRRLGVVARFSDRRLRMFLVTLATPAFLLLGNVVGQ